MTEQSKNEVSTSSRQAEFALRALAISTTVITAAVVVAEVLARTIK